jgi:hypothetical protein
MMDLENRPIHSFDICGRIACLAFNQAGDMLAIGDLNARLAVASTNSSEYTDSDIIATSGIKEVKIWHSSDGETPPTAQ